MENINIYRICYTFLHVLNSVFDCICDGFLSVYNILSSFCHELLPLTEKNRLLQNKLHKITRKPRHLTVLLDVEQGNIKDLANLVIWSLASQISFISFHDCKGNLEKHFEEFEYQVSRIKGKNDHIIWHTDQNKEITLKNGFTGNKIHVKILTEEHGRKSIANLTRHLARTKNPNINVQTINESLLKYYEFPDPEMGIVCGSVFSVCDYPPWQMRLTEFFRLKSCRDLSFSVFLDFLAKFSKCEQRLGK